jgi:hypothetical protein
MSAAASVDLSLYAERSTMASRNDVAVAWAWISILGRRPAGPNVGKRPIGSKMHPSQAAIENGQEKNEDPEGFEEDFRTVSRTWTGPIH